MPLRHRGGGASGWQAHAGAADAAPAPRRHVLFLLRHPARPVLPPMSPRLAASLVWGAIAAMTLVTLALLARNILTIWVNVPLDPNEGWNGAHALALLAG